ncbi:Murein DD-endopeptidase MepM and murein hydrolase activator NlpD, contain LysM domain [Actinacidiphila alni]|uniref:Murein DD-endopeptidase MepM and murein hydrolase activator NlpD, contain LysM domain n=1 Tax=Actinacidiphila alni TaxID=380248 RepID=A0A1I2DKU1_9ACTN|nr:M23 family metallopeptidase [Actinacidiphila alni]SFE81058.1 Murein DD-endopeptidase MepM and murein hydrolase activator NlpD, contain LysM domain [Actinacidiphila alni]
MNERPASGYAPDYDAYGYDPYSTGTYQTVGTAFADADPLFGPGPDATGSYSYVQQPAQTPPYGQGYDQQPHIPAQQQPADPYAYDPYATGNYQTVPGGTYDTGTYSATGGYDTGTYGTGTYDTSTYAAYDPYAAQGAGAYYDTGTYDSTAFQQQPAPQQEWDSGAYPQYGYGYGYDAGGDTGIYEQVRDEATAAPAAEAAHATREFEAVAPTPETEDVPDTYEPYAEDVPDTFDAYAVAEAHGIHDDEPAVEHSYAEPYPADGEPVARSRRRKPARRSALLTVAVPSVAVMGVAAVGAAAVAGVGMADSSKTQADGAGTKTTNAPTTQLDRQLAGVSADADDFATRASRTQERIDLKDREAAAKKAKEEAAARKEALRPKFLLPVKQKGLSAYFGQAGVNWMALHTGIDFPVQVGTPVMAVTDGTVRTQWNSSYGNMAIVTAPDGTETWYCHLSSTKIRSGSVKAGTVIAYSGNTGNTTGPHLHLEVRPHGGSPIDPLPWLLSHGLDPR